MCVCVGGEALSGVHLPQERLPRRPPLGGPPFLSHRFETSLARPCAQGVGSGGATPEHTCLDRRICAPADSCCVPADCSACLRSATHRSLGNLEESTCLSSALVDVLVKNGFFNEKVERLEPRWEQSPAGQGSANPHRLSCCADRGQLILRRFHPRWGRSIIKGYLEIPYF